MQQLDKRTQTIIVQSLSEKLKAHYVFPDVAEKICKYLDDRLAAGSYTDITDGEIFASVLVDDLRTISHDKHVQVKWFPEPLPEQDGPMLQNPMRVDQFRQRAKSDNYGIHKLERLPGNVGYMDIRYFYRPSWGSGETAVAAMNFLANMNALIIDLRQCRGGNPGIVALISSYLFEGEPINLNSFYMRQDDFTQQYWTLPYVPGKRIGENPVFVLTGEETFSAGEEFAYNLQAQRRATLVGERTAGGAHPGSLYRLHPHFEVFIPVGRAINPVTNQNWQTCGVSPDIFIPQAGALDAAYKMALELILAHLGDANAVPAHKLLEEAHIALADLQNT